MKSVIDKGIYSEIKDFDEKRGEMHGLFSQFDNIDSDNDRILFGAYAKTIAEIGPESPRPRIKHYLNHNINLPVGRLTYLKESTELNGLEYRSIVGTNTVGRDVKEMVLSGLITEHSVSFKPIKWEQVDRGGRIGYDFKEVSLFEGSSLTGWGANELTPLYGMKSTEARAQYIEELKKRVEAVESFCRKSTASDELIDILLYQAKRQQAMIEELLTSPTLLPREEAAPKKEQEDAEMIAKCAAYLKLITAKL